MSVIELPEITAWEASPPGLAARAGAPRNLPPATFTVGSVDYDEKEVGSTAAMMDVTRITLAAGTTPPAYTLSCG